MISISPSCKRWWPGGTAPDVFELNYENFVSYASKGVLADLTPLAAADSGFAGQFYPAYQAFNRDGKQFGLPQSFSDVVLFITRICSTRPRWATQPPIGRGRRNWKLRKS